MVTFLHLEKNVRFLGYQKNFYEKLAGYDCGIMCSRSEGFGRVTVEYMMAGLPVLASDTGANAELIENGVTGLLYHFPDVENLKNELLYMLEHKKEVSDMGIASLKRGGGFFRRKHGRFGVQTVSTGLKIKTEFRDWTLSRSIINMAVLR